MKDFLEKFGLIDINGYKYFAQLKGGKMSHSAIYIKDNDKVVVKFLLFPRNDFELSSFKSEIENLNRLKTFPVNNYLVKPLSDLQKHPAFEIYYFIIEYIDGISLSEHFKENCLPLPLNDALDFLKKLAIALSTANALGIIHKDFHFGNIIILKDKTLEDNDPGLRIIDFGLSEDYIKKLYYNLQINDSLRHIGAVSSWSPEYLTNPKSITPTHDIWALGTLIFKILTDSWPFEANSFGEYYELIIKGKYNKLPLKSLFDGKFVEHLFNRMFDVNPNTRIRQRLIVELCDDYFNGTIERLKRNKILEDFYYQYDGDIVTCSRCYKVVHPNGVICPNCGNRDYEYLPFEIGGI